MFLAFVTERFYFPHDGHSVYTHEQPGSTFSSVPFATASVESRSSSALILPCPFGSARKGLRGAVRYFMTEIVQDQAAGIASGVGLLFLVVLELFVLGLQIEG